VAKRGTGPIVDLISTERENHQGKKDFGSGNSKSFWGGFDGGGRAGGKSEKPWDVFLYSKRKGSSKGVVRRDKILCRKWTQKGKKENKGVR